MNDPSTASSQTLELEAAARRATAELALATAQAERAMHALAAIRELCATHEGAAWLHLIQAIDTAAAAAQEAP